MRTNPLTVDADAYILEYAADSSRIRFAWNRQHAERFEDANQEFCRSVLARTLLYSENASFALIRDLFIAETNWTSEAWCVGCKLNELATLFLMRGRVLAIDDFLLGRLQSFDTWCACGSVVIPSELRLELSSAITQRLLGETDAETRSLLEEGLRFFQLGLEP